MDLSINLVGQIVVIKDVSMVSYIGEYVFDQWEVVKVEGSTAYLASVTTPGVKLEVGVGFLESVLN